MIEILDLSKGFSLSFHILKVVIEDINYIYQSIKKFTFSEESRKGVLDLKKQGDYIEFDYCILNPKTIEFFENNKNIVKKVFFRNISKAFIGKDFLIFLGGMNQLKKVLIDIKNLTNLDIKRKMIKPSKMNNIYKNFQKVNRLRLYDESDPFIHNFGLNGDLTDIDNWKNFYNADVKIIEISGIFDTPYGPINLKIGNDCSGQLYKGKIDINNEFLFWFKDELLI